MRVNDCRLGLEFFAHPVTSDASHHLVKYVVDFISFAPLGRRLCASFPSHIVIMFDSNGSVELFLRHHDNAKCFRDVSSLFPHLTEPDAAFPV